MSLTFDQLRREAYRLLADAEDALRDANRGNAGGTSAQHDAVYAARKCIAAAKGALNEAAHRENW